MPNRQVGVRIQAMEKAEFKQIADHVKDWERRLSLLLYDHVDLETELAEFYRIIKLLMDAAFEADEELKPLLASLEYKARKCKSRIEELLLECN